MTSKLELAEWAHRPVGDGKSHLLMRASFEDRSIAIAEAFGSKHWGSATIFTSKRSSDRARGNIDALNRHLNGELISVELDKSAPLEVASELTRAVGDFVERVGLDAAVVDVTSFRREELLILLAILRSKLSDRNLLHRWTLAYVGALEMGDWLSGKVTSVRSVFGFPGDIRPSRSTRLVVMLGFEVNRARSIIEAYEPKQIVLGMGYKTESINETLYVRNKRLFEHLRQEFQESVEATFEFSARDPLKVQLELDEVIGANDNSNIVIAPLHTKLSTVGAGLYALNSTGVQVCYAPVEEYNEDAYSAPSPDVFLVPLNSMFRP
jgi:hypothetical protein